MMKKSIFFTIIIFLSLSAFLYAEDGGNLPIEHVLAEVDHQSALLPDDLAARMEFIGSEIDKKNAFELLNGEILHATYNSDGTLADVTYDDGLKALYSYERDAHGEISRCDIELSNGCDAEGTRAITLTFRLADEKSTDPADSQSRELELPLAEDTPVVVYHLKSRQDLEDIACKPAKFDYKEINKAISTAEDLKTEAFKEFEADTSGYYDRLETILPDKRALFENTEQQTDRRAAIDRAVEDAYLAVGRGEGSAGQAELISVEKSLREKILDPARQIYGEKMKAAQEYIDNMIEKLIASKIAVYLIIGNDKKIDTVINLQEPKK